MYMLFKILSLGANARTKVVPQLDLALAASESVALVSIKTGDLAQNVS